MNLATRYLGLELSSPLVVGASPFCDDVRIARKLESAGAAALVMRSLFEEQITPQPRRAPASGKPRANLRRGADFSGYLFSAEKYVQHVGRLKRSVSIPIIASLNVRRPGEWITFAQRLEQAGADAIEVNFYRVVTDTTVGADEVETEMLKTVGELARTVTIPIAVKLSPFHAAVAQLALALELSGAAGLVLFNRFYQPDIDIDKLVVKPTLRLSERGEVLLRLRWLANLSPTARGSLSATGGFYDAASVVKALLVGADTVQIVSALLKHGPKVLGTLRKGLLRWMREHDYTRLDEFRGLLDLRRCKNPAAYERANYIRVLQSWGEEKDELANWRV